MYFVKKKLEWLLSVLRACIYPGNRNFFWSYFSPIRSILLSHYYIKKNKDLSANPVFTSLSGHLAATAMRSVPRAASHDSMVQQWSQAMCHLQKTNPAFFQFYGDPKPINLGSHFSLL